MDAIITPGVVTEVVHRISTLGTMAMAKDLRRLEPNLFDAISTISSSVLCNDDSISSEHHEAIYFECIRACLLTFECYRLASFRLWLNTPLATAHARSSLSRELDGLSDAGDANA